jgi:hypothetical protein
MQGVVGRPWIFFYQFVAKCALRSCCYSSARARDSGPRPSPSAAAVVRGPCVSCAQFAGLDSLGAHARDATLVEEGSEEAAAGRSAEARGENGQPQEGAYALEFVEPLDGDTVSSTPFRVALRTTGGFRVPDDGEIRLTMTYPGRGQDVRVLQSTEFQSWNIVGGDFTISAMLVSTKDEPLSDATTVQVKTEA